MVRQVCNFVPTYKAYIEIGMEIVTVSVHRRWDRLVKLCKPLSIFIGGILILCLNVGLKSFHLQGLSEPEFNGDLVYKVRKIIGQIAFPYHFQKIIVCYKKIVIT